ncbi:MAG: hypothetical protein HQK49_08310 [Oligoflexia bacterium]|nr:hypothetical protein [Oligoflexia bacterium]
MKYEIKYEDACAASAYAASAVDSIDVDESVNKSKNSPSQNSDISSNDSLFSEKIVKIGATQKIFILTNENKNLSGGDFITLIQDNQMIARALVAKIKDDQAGVKILKIYSIANWNRLRASSEVKILKGDDSYYLGEKKKNLEAAKKPSPKSVDETKDESSSDIPSEKELLSDSGIEDENGTTASEEKGRRAIKTDNIISGGYGLISAANMDGNSKKFAHWNAQYAYQVYDNFWAEGIYGMSTLKAFPSNDLDTKVTSMIVRAKYTIAAPFYSYVQPYVGYKIVKASCPDAGVESASDKKLTDAKLIESRKKEREKEPDVVLGVEKNTVVFGATVLKRLVPGWFIKVDVGTDLLNLGFSFEF